MYRLEPKFFGKFYDKNDVDIVCMSYEHRIENLNILIEKLNKKNSQINEAIKNKASQLKMTKSDDTKTVDQYCLELGISHRELERRAKVGTGTVSRFKNHDINDDNFKKTKLGKYINSKG